MSLNLNSLLDRIEILFISTITTYLTGVTHIRAQVNTVLSIPQQAQMNDDEGAIPRKDDIQEKLVKSNWTVINQAFVSLITWMILGFAAGFLIGMITPR